jgi:hypothetical protein
MKCPGQDMRYWKAGAIFDIECPHCGHRVEFFKDESTRKCGGCGHKLVNPKMDFGCAAYCKYAQQCVGDLPPEVLAQKEDLLKDRVAIEMKRYFKQDFKRIGHATRVARYAEKIVKAEKGDPAIVLSAAYLHDTGVSEVEAKHRNTDLEHPSEEGPPVAREILSRLDAREELIEEVCDIIAHHNNPGNEETVNFRVVYDADLIAKLEEEQKEKPRTSDALSDFIGRSFLTKTGRELAEVVLLSSDQKPVPQKGV